MSLLQEIAAETFHTLYLAAPFLLLGLLMAGFIHVLLPERVVRRFLGRPGMGGVVRAAAIGVPLPVCSCGVVPLALEMRRKGASQPASVSFLVTTPESSADSILLTWGLMGPVMAIARPIAAFGTAVIGGLGAMLFLPEDDDPQEHNATSHRPSKNESAAGSRTPSSEVAGRSAAREAFEANRAGQPLPAGEGRGCEATADRTATGTEDESDCGCDADHLLPSTSPAETGAGAVVRRALRYGFVEMLDDLAFWLLLGLLAAGVLGALVPDDLAAYGLGGGVLPMVLVLAFAVPIYMCASASTPVAAALLAKGLSPGAALVFLLAGPATNVATVVLLARTFGRRFVAVYLAGVIAGALLAGLALDALVVALGLAVAAPLTAGEHPAFSLLAGASTLLLSALLVWRLSSGALSRGWSELRHAFGSAS